MSTICQSWFRAACGVAAVSIAPASAVAGPSDPLSTLNHAVAACLRNDAQFLSRTFGDDPGAPIPVTFTYDTDALSFDYAVDGGATYLGMPLAIEGHGTYDVVMERWDVSVTGDLGQSGWSGDIDITEVDIDQERREITFNAYIPWLFNIIDYHERNVITTWPSGLQSSAFAWVCTFNGQGIFSGTAKDRFVCPDPLHPEGEWRWFDFTFALGSGAFGGTGGSASVKVPAPAATCLVAVGVFGRRRRA